MIFFIKYTPGHKNVAIGTYLRFTKTITGNNSNSNKQ